MGRLQDRSPIAPVARTVPALIDLVRRQQTAYRATFTDLIALLSRLDMNDAAQIATLMAKRVGILSDQAASAPPKTSHAKRLVAYETLREDIWTWAGDGRWFDHLDAETQFGKSENVNLAIRSLVRAGEFERKFVAGRVQWRASRIKEAAS